MVVGDHRSGGNHLLFHPNLDDPVSLGAGPFTLLFSMRLPTL
jgi:hypothetical protein